MANSYWLWQNTDGNCIVPDMFMVRVRMATHGGSEGSPLGTSLHVSVRDRQNQGPAQQQPTVALTDG